LKKYTFCCLLVIITIITLNCLSGCGDDNVSLDNTSDTSTIQAHLISGEKINLTPRDNGLFDLQFNSVNDKVLVLNEDLETPFYIYEENPIPLFVDDIWPSCFSNGLPYALLFVPGENDNWEGIVLNIKDPVYNENKLIFEAIWIGDTRNNEAPNIEELIENSFLLVFPNSAIFEKRYQSINELNDNSPYFRLMHLLMERMKKFQSTLKALTDKLTQVNNKSKELNKIYDKIKNSPEPVSLTTDLYNQLYELGVNLEGFSNPTENLSRVQKEALMNTIKAQVNTLTNNSQKLQLKVQQAISSMQGITQMVSQQARAHWQLLHDITHNLKRKGI